MALPLLLGVGVRLPFGRAPLQPARQSVQRLSQDAQLVANVAGKPGPHAWLAARRGGLLGASHWPLEMIGMYWNFVDVIWLFLLPLLYLAGPA